jgi:Ca2+-binding RTX toxin-like protein
MPLSNETVSLAGSGIVFNNTYDAGVTDAVRAAIITAENYLQSHFTDTATLNITFDYVSEGPDQIASNVFIVLPVQYSRLVAALTAHATTADDQIAVAGLPTVDPSNGAGFEVASGLAQALGLASPSGLVDVTVKINSDEPWTFGSDLVGAIEHEITEGGFGRFQSLGLNGPLFSPLDLFRFTRSGQHDFSGGADGQRTVFGLDATHLTSSLFHNSLNASGVNDGFDLADWDHTFEDAFGAGGGGMAASISPVDLQVLDVLGWTPSGAPAGSGPDDFANGFSDAAHPFGQLVVNTATTATLQAIGDHDWFKVQLNAGTDYVINLTAQSSGGGTLDDPVLTLHGADGAAIASNDDLNFESFDSRLIVHPTVSGTYYIEANSFGDFTTGSYTVAVQAGAAASSAGNDYLVGTLAGGSIMAGGGNDTIVADNAQNYLRGEDGDDSIAGGSGFDDINGNMGADTIDGGLGDDWVVGGKGDDQQFGYDGDDIVLGNLGNDTLDGGFGADVVRGGQGDDVLFGGPGADYVSGDRGNDTETGGSGADNFHSFSGAGVDRVLDFSLAQGDRVMLDPGTTFTVSQVGADTVIDMGNGDQLILVGVQAASLPPGAIFLG